MRRIPCRRSRVETMRRSFWPSGDRESMNRVRSERLRGLILLPLPSNRSRQATSLIATVQYKLNVPVETCSGLYHSIQIPPVA